MYLNTLHILRTAIVTPALLVIFMTGANAQHHKQKTPDRATTKMYSAAPQYLVKDSYGKVTDIARQKGKVVFLNFWALSCAPCKAEMPGINQLYTHFKADTNVLFLPVDMDHDLATSMDYMAKKGFALKVYEGASAVPETIYRGQIPTTVIIDKEGNTIFFTEGEEHYDDKKFVDLIAHANKQ